MAVYSVSRRRIIVLLVLTSILVLTLDLRGNRVFDTVRSGFAAVLSPVESAARVVTNPIRDAWRGVTRYDDLLDENQRLQAQIDAQRGAEIAAREALIENQQLLAQNELQSLAQIDTVTATVEGRGPSNFDQTIDIDKGSNDCIEVGMAVVNEAGLVGKVTAVSPTRSVVMLLTDTAYRVGVKVVSLADTVPTTTVPDTVPTGELTDDVTTTSSTTTSTTTTLPVEQAPGDTLVPGDTAPTGEATTTSAVTTTSSTTTTTIPIFEVPPRETGALVGLGPGRLPQATLISSTPIAGEIEVGDVVLTSGGPESLAPANIPVGVVVNKISPPGSAGDSLEIEPSVDVRRLQFVRVVLYQPDSSGGGC